MFFFFYGYKISRAIQVQAFGIGQCMMVMLQVVTACCRYGLQLMILQLRQHPARNTKRVIKVIIRVVHLIGTEHRLQAIHVELLVVGHQRQTIGAASLPACFVVCSWLVVMGYYIAKKAQTYAKS